MRFHLNVVFILLCACEVSAADVVWDKTQFRFKDGTTAPIDIYYVKNTNSVQFSAADGRCATLTFNRPFNFHALYSGYLVLRAKTEEAYHYCIPTAGYDSLLALFSKLWGYVADLEACESAFAHKGPSEPHCDNCMVTWIKALKPPSPNQ
ncbi:MAG TPA: hypothetical protein VEL47_00250 [Myxococcota bacterium]|nr:hypothetical protein [Myxococcota bacterium]